MTFGQNEQTMALAFLFADNGIHFPMTNIMAGYTTLLYASIRTPCGHPLGVLLFWSFTYWQMYIFEVQKHTIIYVAVESSTRNAECPGQAFL